MVDKKSTSSIGKNVLMALSGLFVMFFLLQHLVINMLSVISADLFNQASHFMGTNPLVQFVLQPVLISGFLFHLIMGIYLEYKNNQARPIKYEFKKSSANSSWISRNMIITGIMIMMFLGLHFYDFWIPEINIKFIEGDWSGRHGESFRYWDELNHKFHDMWRVIIYCISFIFLSLHLLHGFQSSFQSSGLNNNYISYIKKFGNAFAILVPCGFIFIAIFHYLLTN